jgi:hypothetical protein
MNVLYINIDLAGLSTSFQYARFTNSENKRSAGRLRARVCVKSNDIYPHIIPSLLFGKRTYVHTLSNFVFSNKPVAYVPRRCEHLH